MHQLLVVTYISQNCEHNVCLYDYAGRKNNQFQLAISKIVLRVKFKIRFNPESCTAENSMWK